MFGEAEGCKPFASLLQDDGSAFPMDLVINDDDVALLPYSSGTTGLPKGVMLMHKNVVSDMVAIERYVINLFPHL